MFNIFYLLICNLFNMFDRNTTVLTCAFGLKIILINVSDNLTFCKLGETLSLNTLRFEYDKNRTVSGSFIRQFEESNESINNNNLIGCDIISVIMCPILLLFPFLCLFIHFISDGWSDAVLCCDCVLDCAFIGFSFNLIGFGFRFQYDRMNDFAFDNLFLTCCFAFGSE